MRMDKRFLVILLAGVFCASAIAVGLIYSTAKPVSEAQPGSGNAGVQVAGREQSNIHGDQGKGENAQSGKATAPMQSAQRGSQTVKAKPAGAVKRDLTDVEHMVRNVYADVAQLPASRLGDLQDDKHDVVVIDVREANEFGISHIDGAVRVDPGVWTSAFMSKFGKEADGKTFVFYCSVGVRSSKLAGRVQSKLKELGAAGVYNLEGGIFRWHNEQRMLVNAEGMTQFVHKYDDSWGELVSRQDFAVTQP